MNISLNVHNSLWEIVYKIPFNSPLVKGRHGLYHEITQAAGQIQNRFGCYAWGTSECLFYVGSFSKDYKRGNHKSNLHGRVHNYLQNHRLKENGQKNTNLMVFENINEALQISDVSLYIFKFDYLEIGSENVDYLSYTEDTDLVRAVEQLLICTYRKNKQCIWNRS